VTAGVATGQRAWVEQIMGMPVSIHLRGADLRCAAVEEVVEAAFEEQPLGGKLGKLQGAAEVGRGGLVPFELGFELGADRVKEVIALEL